MDGFDRAVALLPAGMRRAALALPPEERARCEELRLRLGREPAVLLAGREYGLGCGTVGEDDLRAVAEAATRCSFHAAGEQLRRGFLSAPGGVRVGLCGTAVTDESGMTGLRELSSAAIRIPKAVSGCADGIWDGLMNGGFRSTLISSSPGVGKTTLLRELARKLSETGCRVAVADERGELAGAWDGGNAFDLGPCTDVLTGAPKAQAAVLLLRAMNPQALVMDEVTEPSEAEALCRAAGSGVILLASVHARRDSRDGSLCRELLTAGIFHRRVWVECRGGQRLYTVERIPCG